MGIHPSLRRRLLLCREHHQPRTPSRTTHDRAGSGLHPTTTPRPAGVVPRVRTHRRSLGAGETGPELVTSKTSRPHRGALPRPPRPRPPTKCHPEQGHQRADIVKVTASVPEVSTIGRRTTSARPTKKLNPDHEHPLILRWSSRTASLRAVRVETNGDKKQSGGSCCPGGPVRESSHPVRSNGKSTNSFSTTPRLRCDKGLNSSISRRGREGEPPRRQVPTT